MKRFRLFGLALVLTTTAAVLGCGSDAARIAAHLERAEAYREDDKPAEAILEYRNVLQIAPNHAGAHFGLAQILLADKRHAEAVWEFRETVRVDPGNLEARLRLAELLGGAGAYDEALAQVEAILAAETAVDDPELRLKAQMMRARALDLQNKPVEALAAYQKALELAPEATEPILLLANYYRRQGERQKAEPLFRRLVETSPGYVSYAALAGFLAGDRARDAETEEVYELAVESADEEERIRALRILASFYYGRARFEEAEATLQRALEARPEDLELIYLLARFYLSRGEKEKADGMIELATQARPDEVEPYLILSRYRFQTGEKELALEALDRALEVDPGNDAVRLERAERVVDLGVKRGPRERIREAREVVQQVLERDAASSEALGLQGKLDLLEGRTEDAVRSLRQAIQLRPDWPPLRALLGSALFFEGDFLAAREELERALGLDPALLEARIVLTRTYAGLGKHSLVVAEGESVLLQRPRDHAMRLLVAQSLLTQRQMDEAIDQLDQIPEAERDLRTLFTYGRVFATKGDRVQARRFYLQAETMAPGNPEILYKLLELDRREGRLEQSMARIEKALASSPNSSALVHLQGMAELMLGRSEEAESRFRQAIELNPSNPGPYTSLARLMHASGRGDEALETYEKAARERPDLASLHLIVATLHEFRGNTERAIAHYEDAIRQDPRLVAAKNDLANLLAEKRRDLERALQLAQEARSALPDNPQVADTMGWVLYRMGMTPAAIGYLEEAVALASDDPDGGPIRYHLAKAYVADGQRRKARDTIERALAQLDPEASANGEPEWAREMRKLKRSLDVRLVGPRGQRGRGRPR